MKRAVLGVILGLLAAASALADQVFLKGGGTLSGVIVQRNDRAIVLEVAPGRVTVPMSRVERVVEGASSLAAYLERASRLPESDAAGWLRLAQWAADSGLQTQARAAFERVLALDPANEAAHRALGDVAYGGRWMTPEESYRAQGLVPFEGAWVTPAEQAALIRQRTEEAAAESARAEATARAREAEARARQAEADAQRAEAEASQSGSGGLPYPWIFAGGGCGVGCGPHARPHSRPSPPRVSRPQPQPTPPPRARFRN